MGNVARWLPRYIFFIPVIFHLLSSSQALATGSVAAVASPQPPAIMRNVSMIQAEQYMYPYIPSFRTSADGRVALSAKELAGGKLQFYLFVPENFNSSTGQNIVPFALSAGAPSPVPQSTPQILPSPSPFPVPDVSIAPSNVVFNSVTYPAQQQHHTICDGTMPFASPTVSPSPVMNPYPCGTSGQSDCYNLTVISGDAFTDNENRSWSWLYGTPIVVKVNNPKTSSAYIANITVQTPVAAPSPLPIPTLLEPMVTADGHLLVARTNGGAFSWVDNSSPVPEPTVTGSYNIFYALAPQTANPCDVTQWTNMYPIAHAPSDPNMKNPNTGNAYYGFADVGFRDTEGSPIPENADIEGTYPWIDRMGRNLFFSQLPTTLFVKNGSGVLARYPESCVPGYPCVEPTNASSIPNSEITDNTRGVTVVGRWTHGKEVLLDGLINNIDYGLQIPEDTQRMVGLYYPSPIPSPVVSVQLGSGRSNVGNGNPPGCAENSTIVDSFENIFTYVPALRPATLRDVVWRIDTGKGSDEIAFDDYLNPQALIISEMTASVKWQPYSLMSGKTVTHPPQVQYNDGFVSSQDDFSASAIHLQNSATSPSTNWNIPAYGQVVGTSARIEPAALGGIKGKGFWLSGSTQVNYSVPTTQPQSPSAQYWFVNLFIDPRFSDDPNPRPLVTFPDGSSLDLVGLHAISLTFGGNAVYTANVQSPLSIPSDGWSDISLEIAPGGTEVAVYLNGYMLGLYQGTQALFQIPTQGSNPPPPPGNNITLAGGSGSTFVGWVDDFKVIGQTSQAPMDPETICNHARGTLVGVPSNYSGTPNWWTIAGKYSSAEHTQVKNLVKNFFTTPPTRYACIVNYANDFSGPYMGSGNMPGNVPSSLSSVRNYIHFPEGPLQWNVPRPNSSGNTFCLSCHTGQNTFTLTNEALVPNPNGLDLQYDTRRQPLQLPRIIYGNVPGPFIYSVTGVPQPGSLMQSPPSTILLDLWDYPQETQ